MIRKCSFKGVPFEAEDSDHTIGRRLVVHEYPQLDTPFPEDMGRMTRKFNLNAFVIGSDWENERDAIVAACEKQGEGSLIHPAYGKLTVYCESCTVKETFINGQGKASISMVFVEVGANLFPNTLANTQVLAKSKALQALTFIQKAFNLVYNIQGLPVRTYDYITTQLQTLAGVNVYQILNIVDAAKGLTTVDKLVPSALSTAISSFASSYRSAIDSFDESKHATIESISVKQALTAHDKVIKVALNYTKNTKLLPTVLRARLLDKSNSKNNKLLLINAQHINRALAASCVVEQCHLSSYLTFKDNKEAAQIWAGIIDNINAVLQQCAADGDDNTFQAVNDVALAFHQDILARAPQLNKIRTLNITGAVPSIVIAYDLYENASRDVEIIARNNIKNPCFCFGTIKALND